MGRFNAASTPEARLCSADATREMKEDGICKLIRLQRSEAIQQTGQRKFAIALPRRAYGERCGLRSLHRGGRSVGVAEKVRHHRVIFR